MKRRLLLTPFNKLTVKVKMLLLLMSIVSIGAYGQTTFDGATITSSAQTADNISVLSTGSKKNGNVCNSATKLDYLEIGSSPIYLEIRIPDHATKKYKISITASNNSTGTAAYGLGVVYSDESSFNE